MNYRNIFLENISYVVSQLMMLIIMLNYWKICNGFSFHTVIVIFKLNKNELPLIFCSLGKILEWKGHYLKLQILICTLNTMVIFSHVKYTYPFGIIQGIKQKEINIKWQSYRKKELYKEDSIYYSKNDYTLSNMILY